MNGAPALPFGAAEETQHRTMMRHGSGMLLRALRGEPEDRPQLRARRSPQIEFRRSIVVQAEKGPRQRWHEKYVRMADRKPIPTPAAVREIMENVAEAFDVPPDWLTTQTRCRAAVLARAVAIKLTRDRTWENGEPRHSTIKIGAYFNREHSTISHALEHFEDYCKHFPEIVPVYKALRG